VNWGGRATPTVLTSWKEVANYLGKGVRTVQRWEKVRDLPVRRPLGSSVNTILALPEEIDEWVRSRNVTGRNELNADLAGLRQQNLDLQNELQKLQAKNEMLNRALQLVLFQKSAGKEH
jgi:predicted DNA-binding transcriptional regulator AlpA